MSQRRYRPVPPCLSNRLHVESERDVPAARLHTDRPGSARWLTANQIAAVRVAMQIFAEEDRENGMSARYRLHCHACRHPRPAPGFVPYGDVSFCNACATEYEIARMRRLVATAHDFVRMKARAGMETATGEMRRSA